MGNLLIGIGVAIAQVNDLHAWAAWSPYEKKDPDMQRTFDGAPSGTGAVYSWKCDRNVGEGRMRIALHLSMNMDRMVGDDFESGLAALKTVSETGPGVAAIAR